MSFLNFAPLRAARVVHEPFDYFFAHGALTPDQAAAVRADFPDIRKPGYFPLSQFEAKGAFAQLVADLKAEELANVLEEKFGVPLADRPRMITVRRLSQLSDGKAHNDSRWKILTMLVYLNARWSDGGPGCIRALNGPDDLDDYAFETPPLAGHVFGFLRSETSWHGHPPYKGERYAVQTAFLTSEEALKRKESRGRLQLALKRLNPFQ